MMSHARGIGCPGGSTGWANSRMPLKTGRYSISWNPSRLSAGSGGSNDDVAVLQHAAREGDHERLGLERRPALECTSTRPGSMLDGVHASSAQQREAGDERLQHLVVPADDPVVAVLLGRHRSRQLLHLEGGGDGVDRRTTPAARRTARNRPRSRRARSGSSSRGDADTLQPCQRRLAIDRVGRALLETTGRRAGSASSRR